MAICGSANFESKVKARSYSLPLFFFFFSLEENHCLFLLPPTTRCPHFWSIEILGQLKILQCLVGEGQKPQPPNNVSPG